VQSQRLELEGLTARVVTPTTPPEATVVLLHGFGAPGDDLVPLAQYLDAPARFVFPAAPLRLGGPYGDGRAWWPLDLERLERELRTGAIRDRRAELPEGLPEARAQLARFLDALPTQLPGAADAPLVLGGFSQGSMLALDVALHREPPPAGMILMSSTLLAEPVWAPRMARLADVPIALSHGRHDPLLPFAIAELLRDQLHAAGARLRWLAFPGGHEIPPPVLDAAGKLVRDLVAPAE
jgi:phospholipase/carboxylesterase